MAVLALLLAAVGLYGLVANSGVVLLVAGLAFLVPALRIVRLSPIASLRR